MGPSRTNCKGTGGTQASTPKLPTGSPEEAAFLYQIVSQLISYFLFFFFLFFFGWFLLGKLSVSQWASSMENVLGLNLPWRFLSSHLGTIDKDGNIDYMSCFDDMHIQKPVQEASETQPQLTPGHSETHFR